MTVQFGFRDVEVPAKGSDQLNLARALLLCPSAADDVFQPLPCIVPVVYRLSWHV
ncbi:hypothetical protein O3P69_008690 [Scylla paramamosain]|uniref:Uncharacterized protein n=1 Tax=Scylla paramamosain TaxID=85552 RepID=A0AAW0SMX7_SCYPA